MNKSRLVRGFRSIVSASAVLFFVLFFAVGAFAASTIGTNFSTTGTLTVTPASDSATSVRFQNAAGTNIFIVNSTSRWVGVGAAPQTTFEVQGTSSASYFLTGNTIQVGGYASVAYNRFGTSATTHATEITTTNDVVINGDLEVDGQSFFDGTASVGGAFEVVGRASASQLFVNSASSSTAYTAEFSSNATTSILFGSRSTTQGTCLQFTNTAGQAVYARIVGTTWTVNALECR